jgi:AcrR family transcriptional regulator
LPDLNQRMLSWLLVLTDPAAAAVHTLMRSGAQERVSVAKERACETVIPDEPRERLLVSALRVAREVGLAEMSAIHIADEAGLPLDAFFEHFEEHEQCLREALEETAARLLAAIPEPGEQSSSRWPVQVCRSISSLLAELGSDQLLTWTVACAGHEIGARGKEHDLELSRKAAVKICAPIPEGSMDEIVIEEAAGAIWHTIWCLQAAGRTHLLTVLDGYTAYLVLAPIIGCQPALEAIEEAQLV